MQGAEREMNVHPVAKALVSVELSQSDAEWLLGEIEEARAAKTTREISLDIHDLCLKGGDDEIVIQDILERSEDGNCTLTFEQFKSLLMDKFGQAS